MLEVQCLQSAWWIRCSTFICFISGGSAESRTQNSESRIPNPEPLNI